MRHFKYISKITGWVACMALLLQVVGCNRSDDFLAGEGALSFEFEQDESLTTKSNVSYTLDIVDMQGDTVTHYPDHRYAPFSIRLSEGVYEIHVRDNNESTEEELFGIPRFGAIQSVTVTAGENTVVDMICGVVNVKVQVVDFVQEIKDNFTNYSLVITPSYEYSGKDTLIFTQTEVDATPQQQGWINQTEKGSFALIFRTANKQSPDKIMTYVQTITDVDPADFYRFTVTMNDKGGVSDGGAMFRLSVHTDNNEYDFPFGVKEKTRPIPVVTRNDKLNINNPMTTNVITRQGDMRVNIGADAGIQRLRIMHTDVKLNEYGLPWSITLGDDHATNEKQRVAGVVDWCDEFVIGTDTTWVDFSDLLNTKRLNDEKDGELLPEGLYPVEIEIYDFDNQMITQEIVLSVARDFATGDALRTELVGDVPGLGAKYAYVNSQWLGAEKPKDLGFEYRLLGEGEWMKVTDVVVDENTKNFIGFFPGLTPSTLYEFIPVGNDQDGKPFAPGSMKVFETDALVGIDNLNFDSWTKGGNTWYPNVGASNSFWATGNEGVTGFPIDKPSNSSPADEVGDVIKGKAARLETLGGITLVKIAAGNIYAGTYKTDMGDPPSSAVMGRAYTGRPIRMKGWYKYTPQIINDKGCGKYGAKVYPEEVGKPDHCSIYIRLENWGGANTRPDASNIKLIASAVLETDQVISNYTQFDMPLKYEDATSRPTHVVIVASSSRYGEDFCGGIGSLLYIDEFELVWEP